MSWDRQFWGVMFTGSLKGDPPMLLGQAWHRVTLPKLYEREPSRALVFQTRAQARKWCAERHAEYRSRTDCCASWRFHPVRVRERVEVVA